MPGLDQHRTPALGFRLMEVADLTLLHDWLERPHVRRWWGEDDTYEDVVARYLPALEGEEPTDLYVVTLEARPIGFIQTYLVSDHPAYGELIGLAEGAAGVDLLVGEEELTGRGIGSEMLRRFVAEIVFARTTTMCCVADPDVRNTASVRAFEKAGFRLVRRFEDPTDGEVHALMRLDRA